MKYHVVVTRDGDGWMADVPALPGTHTWAKTLRALDRNVREVIGMVEDLPRSAEAALDLEMDYHTGDPVLDERAGGCAPAAVSRSAPPLRSPATPPSSCGASPRSFRSAMLPCCWAFRRAGSASCEAGRPDNPTAARRTGTDG